MYRRSLHVHIVCMAGVGMNGIAYLLRKHGYTVSGCDLDITQPTMLTLQDIGCTLIHGNNNPACHDPSIDVYVYSTAVGPHIPELVTARARGIPTIHRAIMLAELMRRKFGIGIAGTHGKTTTTAMIGTILLDAHYDPDIAIGGIMPRIRGTAHAGTGTFFVAECDESDRSFLAFHPAISVITNINLEHLETYSDIDDIKRAYEKFLDNLPFYGTAILNADDTHLPTLSYRPNIKNMWFSIKQPADVYATNIELHPTSSTCTIHTHSGITGTLHLPVAGLHNVSNALAAISVGLLLDIPLSVITNSLAQFIPVDRRFSYRGAYQGAEVFDDYGHHPHEIACTMQVARRRTQKRVIMIFQPHRFTRTQKLWHHFIELFVTAPIDVLYITDIHAAFESPIEGVTAEQLVIELKQRTPTCTIEYVPLDDEMQSLKSKINAIASPKDLILIQGAGKITNFTNHLNL